MNAEYAAHPKMFADAVNDQDGRTYLAEVRGYRVEGVLGSQGRDQREQAGSSIGIGEVQNYLLKSLGKPAKLCS